MLHPVGSYLNRNAWSPPNVHSRKVLLRALSAAREYKASWMSETSKGQRYPSHSSVINQFWDCFNMFQHQEANSHPPNFSADLAHNPQMAANIYQDTQHSFLNRPWHSQLILAAKAMKSYSSAPVGIEPAPKRWHQRIRAWGEPATSSNGFLTCIISFIFVY